MNLSNNLSNLFFTHETKDKHADILNDIASGRRWGIEAAADKHLALLIQGISGDFHENDRLQVASSELMSTVHSNVVEAPASAEHFQEILNQAVNYLGRELVKLAQASSADTEAMLAEARNIVDQVEPEQAIDEQVDQYVGAL